MKVRTKKVTLTLGLFTFLALLPMSCGIFCEDLCGCGPGTPPGNLIIKSMELLTLDANRQQVDPLDTFPFDQVSKSLQVKEFEIQGISEFSSFGYSSFGTAFACSPLPIYSKDEITSLQLINRKEIRLGGGTLLKDLEDISTYFGMGNFYTGKLLPIKEFLGSGKAVSLEESFRLGFVTSPGQAIQLEFDLLVKFQSGKELTIPNQVLSIR
jgi:hypothetical protein